MVCLLPSRYIEYVCDMVAEEPITPHSKPILVKAVVMTPVPLFSKQRNGCRPFCEVYVGDERVTTTSQEYDKMRWARGSGPSLPRGLIFWGLSRRELCCGAVAGRWAWRRGRQGLWGSSRGLRAGWLLGSPLLDHPPPIPDVIWQKNPRGKKKLALWVAVHQNGAPYT